MSSNAGQISENTLQAMEIVAQSVVDRAETTITKDCVVAEIIDSATGAYLVSSGYSSFTAYSLNKTQYKVGDLVYVQMPNAQNDGDKIILGMRQTGDDAYELADNFANVVFFNGRNDSLIKLHDDVGLIANSETLVAYLGSWDGEYSGVTKIGIEGSFVTILKALGAIEGTYGLKLRVMNNVGAIMEYNFPCSEYYGNPYNYIYSTRVNQVFTLTTQTTITRIEAYIYQDGDFYNENDRLIAVAQTSNIILTNLYIGVGKLTGEVLDSKFTIKANSGSTVYQKDGDADLNVRFDTLLHNICSIKNPTEESINNVLEVEFKNFTSVQKTRINSWLEKNEIIKQIISGNVHETEWKGMATNTVLRELSIEIPQIGFSLLINTEDKPEYLTSLPSFDTSTAEGRQMRNLFIRWYRRNREATIDDINLPDELQAGWELTGQFDKNLNPLTDEGYLIFTPNYEVNEETLVALVYYKNKYYMSNQLTLINRVDAKNDQIEDIKKDLMDQAEKDRELIDANKRAVNALVIESGYYTKNEDETTVFNNNNGLYFYYTRSGLIRESEKLRAYGLRCYSSDKDTIIKSLAWEFPQKNTMVKINGGATAKDGYYKQLITIDRKYNPSKTNNIVTVTATCDITVRDENDNIKDVYENVTIENQIELLFGYYSCEGTEHSLTAYWTNSAGEVVNCLVPGKTYEAHLLLDGKEVTSPIWSDVNGNNGLAAAYTPTVGDIHLRKGIVSIEDNMSLGCWLGAKISYNEDNIIEGITQLVYQTDGTLHMRDSATDADVSPQYRLELLLEDERTHNQEYADGIWWDPNSGNQLSVFEIEARINASIDSETKKELIAGWSYDSDGKPNAYFSGPSNWSIVQFNINNDSDRQEFFMRTKEDLLNYETWSNKNSVSCDYFSLVYVPQSQDTPLVRSVVELIPKADYLTNVENYIFGINIYTYTGQLLATIPLKISRNQYASIYIDKMANSTGIVIDSETNTIFSPRILAGKYETTKNVGNTGNKVFTGVALGNFADSETEASMQLAGVYGFRQGQQAYAFKEDGTGFIGLDGKSKIKFNQKGGTPLSIGDNVFTVDTKGDVNLTGSVTGYSNETQSGYQLNIDGSGYIGAGKSAIHFEPNANVPLYIGDTQTTSNFKVASNGDVNLTGSITGGSSNSGYRLDKNGSGYIRRGNYGIYFESNNYPIYISNQANSGSNASFAVDKDGNLNLRGSNIYINGDMQFVKGGLTNYVTNSELKTALSNIDTSIDSQDFKNNLSKLIDNSQGLFWDGSQLTINASKINGRNIQGVKVKAGDIEAGTLNGIVGDGIKLKDVFLTQATNASNIVEDVGQIGTALGSIEADEGFGAEETYGSGMTAGTLKLTQLGSLDSGYGNLGNGSYMMVTKHGFRAGYFYDPLSDGAHNRILITKNSCSITVQGHKLVLSSDGTLTLDGRSL